RSWMIGKMGTAISDINPEGTVDVDGGIWRAITNRATPVMAGGELRVVGIDGMTLEIEPPEGGAIDYRDRRPAASDDPGDEPDSVT
ncbi:MAG: NfeD family protein, partial [Microthrixaceae bacterium]|nr:NfeD family protein [Microthrixaceae bacterium]